MSEDVVAETEPVTLDHIERCFGGAIPAVLATASADHVPNVMYLTRAHQVDHERIALSNQFLSKTARNLAANPRASLLLIDPHTHDEYRLSLVFERTERRGHVFERLRADVDAVAAISGMEDVFRLRAADIFRVVEISRLEPSPTAPVPDAPRVGRAATPDLAALAELAARLGRAPDLDVVVDTVLDGLIQLFGYEQVHLLLLDESGGTLYTVASRGADPAAVGAEVAVGEGLIGLAAQRCAPLRLGGLGQMTKYSRSLRTEFEHTGDAPHPPATSEPGIPPAQSRLVVPAMAGGELVGVLVVDSPDWVAFNIADEHLVQAVATMLGSAIEHVRTQEVEAEAPPPVAIPAETVRAAPTGPTTTVRFFAVDGSTFFDGEYVIKGVAGRILWTLLRQHVEAGRLDFTNKELRLDPSLDLPGYKDNLESRLLLLRRRLDERDAPIRIERTGRGRFRIHVTTGLTLERGDA